jgi:nucleoid DNA-binding protein
MASPSAEDVIHAFAKAVREKLEDHESIQVPGLGTFDVEHRESQLTEGEDGEPRMAPPRDVVTFEPEPGE